MNKVLEAFNRIIETYGKTNSLEGTYDDFLTIKKALQRLEQIDNAKPSEALKCLESFKNEYVPDYQGNAISMLVWYDKQFTTIKQTLLKSQEQEKFIDIIKRKGMFISAKELSLIDTYEDYKNVINERKLQQELMTHITPTLIDWDTLESTPFYTEKEFDIVKRSL